MIALHGPSPCANVKVFRNMVRLIPESCVVPDWPRTYRRPWFWKECETTDRMAQSSAVRMCLLVICESGCDYDSEALPRMSLKSYGLRVSVVQSRFKRCQSALLANGTLFQSCFAGCIYESCLCMAVEFQVAKSPPAPLRLHNILPTPCRNVSATNSAIPTSAPTHPTIWKAAGDGFDVPRNMKISSSATALSFHGDVIPIGSVDHSKNSTLPRTSQYLGP
jgi:hypothetical protein